MAGTRPKRTPQSQDERSEPRERWNILDGGGSGGHEGTRFSL